MDLFEHAAASRRTDPATSRAAGTMNKRPRRGHRDILLEAIERLKTCTAREAFEASDLPPLCCYWKRVSELEQRGLVRVVGQRHDLETNAACQVYAPAWMGGSTE